MDIAALQEALRRFAAERDWAPFHTPKNLATALVVEAAELAELFQWLTPDESLAAGRDAVLRERIGEEIADVLLYAVQLADHAGVDVEQAVARKLVRNASKHPPARPGLPMGTRPAAEREVHVLVDWENVQPGEAEVRSLVPDATDLWLFHGPAQRGVGADHGGFGERAVPVRISRSGKNALDFHLSFYMGYIAARHPDARFVVLSNDQGYAPMLEHARGLGFDVRLVGVERTRKTARKASHTVAEKAPASKRVASARPAKPSAAKAAPTATKTAKAVQAAAAPVPAKAKAKAKAATPAKKAAGGGRAAKTAAGSTKAAHAAAPAPPTPPAPAPASAVSPEAIARRVGEQLVAMPEGKRPTRRARLLGFIGSRLGETTSDAARLAVLEQLLRRGVVSVDPQGGVRYP